VIVYVVVKVGILGHETIVGVYEDEVEALRASGAEIMRKTYPHELVPREAL
jgi:hypothetical protein